MSDKPEMGSILILPGTGVIPVDVESVNKDIRAQVKHVHNITLDGVIEHLMTKFDNDLEQIEFEEGWNAALITVIREIKGMKK